MSERTCKPAPQKTRDKDFSEEQFANICKALGHPVRIRLLRILIEKGECISGDLAEEFSLAPSTVSEHLRILKEAGLVQGTIDGPRRCYCIHADSLREFKRMADRL